LERSIMRLDAVRWSVRCLALAGAVCVFTLFGAAIATAAAESDAGELKVLVRVEWRDEADLLSLSGLRGTVRYSYAGSAIVQVDVSALTGLRAVFPGVVVTDTLEPGVGQWLVVPGSAADLDSMCSYGKLTRLKQEGVYLLAAREGLEERLARFAFSIAPLPSRVETRALLPRAPRPSGAVGKTMISPERLGLMRQVAGSISEDSLRAIVHLVSVIDSTAELRSRHTYRDSSIAVAVELLRERMRAAVGGFGVDSVQQFTFRYGGIDFVRYNVIGSVPGRTPGTGKFVVCAHYDDTGSRTTYSEPGRYWDYRIDPAPGADDNGTGIASVLECARALRGLKFDFDLEFVLFCAEEQGLWGSKAYVAENEALGSNVIGTLNFDMHGFRGSADSTFLRTNNSSAWLSDHLSAVAQAVYDSVGLAVGVVTVDGVYDASDHSSFWVNGYDAVHFFEDRSLPPTNPYYHTIYDTEDKLNFNLCSKVAAVGAASLAYFAETSDPWDLEVKPGDLEFRVARAALPVTSAFSGEVVTIVPRFHNVGGASAESLDVYVRVYDGDPAAGGALIGERLVEGKLAAGAGPMVQPFEWLLGDGDAGQHSIYIVADAGAGEVNLSNNKAWTSLTVSSASLSVRYSYVYPNPVRAKAAGGRLKFFLTKGASSVRLDLYDVSGRRVGGCSDGSCGVVALEPGSGNEINLAGITAGTELAAGVYAYRLRVNDGGGERVSFGRFAVVR